MNKSRWFWVIVLLGVVSAVLTLGLQMSGSRQSLMIGGESGIMMGEKSPGAGGIVSKMMAPLTGSGSDLSMMPPVDYYPKMPAYNDALDEAQRAYEQYSQHEVVVEDVPGYARQLREYFLSSQGRVLSYSVSTTGNYQVAYLTAKVPVAQFDGAQARVAQGVKEVVTESVSAQDITGEKTGISEQRYSLELQIADLEVELENTTDAIAKRRLEVKLTELRRQLANLTDQAESVEQREEYSTVVVTAADNASFYRQMYGRTGSETPGDAMREAWQSLKLLLGKLLILAIWVAVYSIIWAPIVLIVRRLRRKSIA